MDSMSELLECLHEKIADGHGMVGRLRLMGKIDGVDKLIRKIQQEIRFLEKVSGARAISEIRWDQNRLASGSKNFSEGYFKSV